MGIAARGEALFPQQQALVHAEAVLLIDDHETQALELDALLKQGVCADRNLRAAGREIAERANAARPRTSASDQCEIQIERREPRAEVARVLLREQFRRRHDCCLKAGLHSPDGGERGDDRLAATHVSLHEAQHWIGSAEILFDLRPRTRLCARQLEGQGFQEPLHELCAGLELPARVALNFPTQQTQAELMGEQFFEGEAPLRGVLAGREQRKVCIGRRPMQVIERLAQ